MKLHQTSYKLTAVESGEVTQHYEFASSADAASKVRTRLKKLSKAEVDCDFSDIETTEVEVPTTRTDLIAFLNGKMAHKSWITEPVAEAVSK